MPNPWFRMYSEFEDDPKVQMLPEAMQRRLVMLLCARCKEVKLSEEQMAFKWRVSPEQVAETKVTFLQQGFIDENWNLLNWNKRQFLSDSSTGRVRRHRANKKSDETHETKCNVEGAFHGDAKSPMPERSETGRNVTVTPPDTEADTDTEQRRTKTTARSVPPEELAGTLPLVDGTLYSVSKNQVSDWSDAYPGVEVKTELRQMKVWFDANPTRMKTPKGINRAIVGWLTRAQDRSHGSRNGGINGNGHGDTNLAILTESLTNRHRSERNGDVSQRDVGPDNIFALLGKAGTRAG